MPAFDFPNAPIVGSIYAPTGGPVYQWNGFAWVLITPDTSRLFTPADMRMARSMVWWDPLDPATITKNVSNQVSQMTSKGGRSCTATQTVDANKPILEADGLRFNASPAQMNTPVASSSNFRHNRWTLFIFKANIAGAVAANGNFYRFNGSAASQGDRQPLASWNKTSNVANVNWYANNSNNPLPITIVDNTWNFMLSRIQTNSDGFSVGGTHYNSLNGGTEISTGGGLCHLQIQNAPVAGMIGHETANAFDWKMRHILVGSEELTQAEIQRLQGWAAWQIYALNGTMVLPNTHPYYVAAPTFSESELAAQEPSERTSVAEFDAAVWSIANRWTGVLDRTGLGTPTFQEDFTVDPRTNEAIGAGPWFSPAISNTGNTDFFAKGSANDTGSVVGGQFIIKPKRGSSGGRTWSTSLQTVSRTGRIGYVQTYGMWEIKVALFDLDSTLNPEWRPSVWFKSNNFNLNPCVPYVEFDLFELYNREDHNVHSSRWIHKADFPHPDDMQSDKFQSQQGSSDIANAAKWNIANLFDGVLRTWVLDLRDQTNAFVYLEDHEFARCPILPEWRVPWYIILWCDCTTISPTTDVGPWDLMHIDSVKAWAT